jgi:Brp/Blh family beta-carotene 15,15'-monooxygenase
MIKPVTTVRAPALPAQAISNAARQVLWLGPIGAGVALLIAIIGRVPSSSVDVPLWVVTIAAIALAIGIPHGAVDHLILGSRLSRQRLFWLGLAYLLIATAATVAILIAPAPALLVVVAMTVWHFGSGDIEAWRTLTNDPGKPVGWQRVLLIIAAGGAPVVLPLTSPAALATLNTLNSELGALWSAPATTVVRIAVLIAVVLAVVLLLHTQRPWAAIQIMILAALGIFAAPLLAFAMYFGVWHALRHTARLAFLRNGTVTWRGIGQVTAAGLPALVGSMIVVAVVLAFGGGIDRAAAWLWIGLAIVWGLTVPHMALVERFDRDQTREPAVPQ